MSQPDDRRLPVTTEQSPGEERRKRSGCGGSDTAYAAHLLGQGGARRGLRGGRPVIDQAHSAYLGSEWSGSADRRRRRGAHAATSA